MSDARVLDASGDVQGVVDSSLPLQTRTASGDLEPIDLTLESSARGFAPRTSPVAIDIPRSSDDAALLGSGSQRLRVTAGAARAVTGRTLGMGVLYPNADTDTDLFVKPVLHGLETFETLRSSASPETTSLTITSDDGSQLVDRGPNAPLAVMRGTETLARVERPVAWDADHTPVPVETVVVGSTIRLTVRHRSANYAYPIVVDPYVTDTCNSIAAQGAACDGNDWEDTGSGAGFSSWGFEGPADGRFSPYAGWAYLGTGLYIRNMAYNYFWANEIGDWYYWAPTGVNIYGALFWKLSQDNYPDNATCLMVGIIQNNGLWAAGNPHYNCAQQTLDASDLVCAGTNCDRNAGGPDDRVVFAAIAQHSGWNNYWMDHLGGALIYLNENSPPTFDDDLSRTWIPDPNQPFHIQVNDVGLGLRSISFSSPENPNWYYNSFSPVTFPCTGGRTNPCPLGYNVALSCNNLRWGASTIRVVATDVAGNRSQRDYGLLCGDGNRYTTSLAYGGVDTRVNTPSELAAVEAALENADSDSEFSTLWNGLTPEDQSAVSNYMLSEPSYTEGGDNSIQEVIDAATQAQAAASIADPNAANTISFGSCLLSPGERGPKPAYAPVPGPASKTWAHVVDQRLADNGQWAYLIRGEIELSTWVRGRLPINVGLRLRTDRRVVFNGQPVPATYSNDSKTRDKTRVKKMPWYFHASLWVYQGRPFWWGGFAAWDPLVYATPSTEFRSWFGDLLPGKFGKRWYNCHP